MRRQRLLILAVVLAAACARPPVEEQVTIDFSGESDSVLVTAETHFTLQPRNDESRRRVEAARIAAQTNGDPWAVRVERLTPEEERVTFQRQRGTLESVTRAVRIPSGELPRVFSDVAMTMNVLRGDGWRELALYPGSSSRATREQQRHFDEQLASWSRAVARYFTAVHELYSYLDENPSREPYLFAAIVNEKASDGSDPVALEDEEPLVLAVVEAMQDIAMRMDEQEARAETFAETADLIFNPLPARMLVRVPGEVLHSEGFTKSQNDLVIEPIDLLAAVGRLEGRWISPDPLAALLREETPTAKQLAEMPRRSTAVVSASDVAAALREQLARPRTYVVRWRY
ncbi:MAG TPA: hypothetical protein VHL59_03945 [Thermoanaerobaculia bacterium]|nr:hypothetical protein [Thermoanaerobaculia bacterium]